ncbi:MAG TPA: hypothetical protein VJU86_00345 [Pyrinomonadaceae bacterium]|nr:hypothetical protein [Pyrinomonadaceae bacterium]
MKRFLVINLWWITLVVALVMLIAHTQPYKPVKVDHISVILLLVVFLSPFISAIKKIKIGDFEAEIDPTEVQRIRDDVSKVADKDKAQVPEIKNTIDHIKALAESDHVLALAKLRMELERVLNHIYRATHKGERHDHFIPVGKLAHLLASAELLPKDIARTTREVVSICNRALHGEDIRQTDAESVLESGAFLLYELSSYLDEYKYKPTESTSISLETVADFQKARYRITSVVPLVNNPKRNIYLVDQEELDEFLEGYNEYAEFIVEIVREDQVNGIK